MNTRKGAIRFPAILAAVLVGLWIVPPLTQRLRRHCPLRPSAIGEANAIPVFARKYKTSCTTCHAPVPIKLNNFGEAFKNNAFRMPVDDEAMTKIEMQELGAAAWKDQWTKDIYPGVIPAELPISWQMYLDARYDPHKESAGTKNSRSAYWDVPHELEIMMAGTMGKGISFWANMEFKVKGTKQVATSGETPVDFVQVYGQFDHLFDTSLLNLRVGRFEPRAVPFSRVSRRFIAEDFLISGHSLGNGFNMKTMQGGAEFWGAKSVAQTGGGLVYALGLVNGDGDTNADGNQQQDYYGRLSYKFGGMGVSEGAAGGSSSANWIDDSIRLGTFGYKGWSSTDSAKANAFDVLGADLDVWYKKLNVYGAAWKARESAATAIAAQTSTAWMLGADYIVRPWLTGILRYEGADQGTTASKHIRRIIPAVVVGIRPNVTWTTEAHIYNTYKGGLLKTGDDLVRTRLRFIF